MLLEARELAEEVQELVKEVQELDHLLLLALGLVVEVKKKDRRARSTTRKKQSFQENTISGRHIVARAQIAQRPVFKKTVPIVVSLYIALLSCAQRSGKKYKIGLPRFTV